VQGVQDELGFELELVDIDGTQAFTYFVDEDALRARLQD